MAMASAISKISPPQKDAGEVKIPIPEIDLPDPRPDLSKDSLLWNKLLKIAHGTEMQFILHGFRCMGTQLVKGTGTYRLQPILPGNWQRQEYYEASRDAWLIPRLAQLGDVLKKLYNEEESEGLPPG